MKDNNNQTTEGFSDEAEIALLTTTDKSFQWNSVEGTFPMSVLDFLRGLMSAEEIDRLQDMVRKVKKDPSYKDYFRFGKQRAFVSRVKETSNASIIITITKD